MAFTRSKPDQMTDFLCPVRCRSLQIADGLLAPLPLVIEDTTHFGFIPLLAIFPWCHAPRFPLSVHGSLSDTYWEGEGIGQTDKGTKRPIDWCSVVKEGFKEAQAQAK